MKQRLALPHGPVEARKHLSSSVTVLILQHVLSILNDASASD